MQYLQQLYIKILNKTDTIYLHTLGFLVCTSQFPDCLRMDLYWLSPVGTLLGLLPCLGPDHRSFFSVTLSPQYQRRGPLSTNMDSTNNDKEPGRTYVYFDDGLTWWYLLH